jgi:hypothetical protein
VAAVLELSGPLVIVAAVLAAGGVSKVVDPEPTRAMLASMGVRVPAGAARAMGVVELVVGVAAALVGGPVLAGLVAVAYLTFAVVAARLVRLGDAAASCGCFGRLSSRATSLHVAADLVAAGVAVAAAVTGTSGAIGALEELGWVSGIAYLALAALGTWAFVAVLTVLPGALVAARREPAAPAVTQFQLRGRP